MEIKTTGHLRQVLGETLVALRNNQISTEQAKNISRIATQINQSFYAEVKAYLVMKSLNRKAPPLGQLLVGEK